MGESEDKKERRFSQEQYDMLLRCSEEEDITEWNKWREENRDEDILMEDARLCGANLQDAILWGANLQSATLSHANLQGAILEGANLQDATLWDANLQDARLQGANLQDARLCGANLQDAGLQDAKLKCARLEGANLQGARLQDANLRDADLEYANLQGARLQRVNLQDAGLQRANLQDAGLQRANLQDAGLQGANLKGAQFMGAKLQGADCSRAIVDGETLLDERCKVDRNTKFEAVAFGNMRIYPKTRQLLECNVRRMNWEDWYKEHWMLAWLIKPFWWMSDYGMSTVRVVGVFFLLALLFAGIYANLAYCRPPGIVSNLGVQPEMGEAELHYFFRALVRPVYFSIVTMTTLGFGDMYANKGSIAGHVILGVQVILGYVLLGALVTRFAVLFTVGGPAGKFEEQQKKVDSVSSTE